MVKRRHRVAGVCLALALGACGSDEPTDEEAVEIITEQLQESDSDALDVSDEQIDCIAVDTVERFGAERVIELAETEGFDSGFVLPDDEARELADAFFDCVSISDLLTSAVEADPTVSDVPQAFVDCIADNVDEEAARVGLATEFSGEPGGAEALGEELGAEAAAACLDTLTPERLEDLADG